MYKSKQIIYPIRKSFGLDEYNSVLNCIDFYRDSSTEMSYSGLFTKKYSDNFIKYQGGDGYALPVNSGSNAIYISILSLNLARGSTILISAMTDPGTFNAIIIAGYVPKIVDNARDSFTTNYEEIEKRIDKNVSAVIVVHSLGIPANTKLIYSKLKEKKIKLIEDCSQAHGAHLNYVKVGNFSDIAIFSTMYTKSHITGSSGGIIYTKNKKLFNNCQALSDRGKPLWKTNLNQRDPSNYLYPALNFNTDEISCSIGLASLKRLDDTIKKRFLFIKTLNKLLLDNNSNFSMYQFEGNESPYSIPICIKSLLIYKPRRYISSLFLNKNIPGNYNYKQIITDWQWSREYCFDNFKAVNANLKRNETFLLYVNEKYTPKLANNIYLLLKNIEMSIKKNKRII